MSEYRRLEPEETFKIGDELFPSGWDANKKSQMENLQFMWKPIVRNGGTVKNMIIRRKYG